MGGVDIAYLYGEPPATRPGNHLISGRVLDTSNDGKQADHPCPRKIQHVKWLVDKWSNEGETIIDPFAGACTTGLASKGLNRKCICIDIKEKYCETGAKRMCQEVMDF